MVTLDCETERTDGVTLVRLYVTAEHRRRVRVENRLDGPVWPPRREGQPAAGWDGDTFEGVVAPDERLVAGYATPAPPADPPAEVVGDDPAAPGTPAGPVGVEGGERTPADRARAADGGETERAVGGSDVAGVPSLDGGTEGEREGDDPTPADVVRSLGDPVVPREAVPFPDVPEDGPDDAPDGSDPFGNEGDTEDGSRREGDPTANGSADEDVDTFAPGDMAEFRTSGPNGLAAARYPDPDGAGTPPTDAALVVPGAVRAWLRDVDRRLAAVERRQAAEGADPDPTLQVAVAGDRRALARVADRVESLVGRAQAVERRAGGDGRR